MPQGQLDKVVRHVRQLADDGAGRLNDRQLLERFARQADQPAFAELVARHGAMVLAVCRRILGDEHEADDAFQAAWLILARKAGAVRWSDSIAAWLHAVAVRVASKARHQAIRRHQRTRELAAMRQVAEVDDGQVELLALVQAELARLPESERGVLVLCYLEGKTSAEAAGELGCPVGSMSKRLARARDLLRRRLEGRGHPVAPAALPVLLPSAAGIVSEALARSTVEAAGLLVSGSTAVAGVASASVTTLVEATLREMSMKVTRLVLLLGLTVLALGAGVGMLGYHLMAGEKPVVKPEPPPRPAPARTLRSGLPLMVYRVVDGERPRLLGMIGPGNKKAINIPAGATWYVQPPGAGGFAFLGGPGGALGGLGALGNLGALGGALGDGGGRPMIPPGGNPGMRGGLGAFGNLGGGALGMGKGNNPFFGTELTGNKLRALIAEMKKQSIPGLCVEGLKMGDAELAQLGGVKGLQTLLLSGTQVSDDGLGKLEGFRSLRFLGLENTEVTEKGVERLGDVKTLTRLHLAGRKITDKGLEALREAKSLQHLRLHDTAVGRDGLAALKSLPELDTLELSGPFSNTDLESLEQLSGLKTLRLYQTKISDDGLQRLARMKGLHSLTLDAHFDLGGLQFPLGIVFQGAGGLGAGNQQWRIQLPTKKSAPGRLFEDIPAPQFTRKGLVHLAALKDLTELRVISNKLADSDMATLGKLTGLKKLVVLGPDVTDAGIAELKGLRALETLDLRGTQMTTAAAPALRGLPRLKVLTTNLVPQFDPKYRTRMAEWKQKLPRVGIQPAWTTPAGTIGAGGR
jgi:RNA polymerase sigma factor (sigma-70 family)